MVDRPYWGGSRHCNRPRSLLVVSPAMVPLAVSAETDRAPTGSRNRAGITNSPISVTPSMPPWTVTPTAFWEPALAPVERRDAEDEGERGHQHRAETHHRAADRDLPCVMPASDRSFANSTVRIAFLAARPISSTRRSRWQKKRVDDKVSKRQPACGQADDPGAILEVTGHVARLRGSRSTPDRR